MNIRRHTRDDGPGRQSLGANAKKSSDSYDNGKKVEIMNTNIIQSAGINEMNDNTELGNIVWDGDEAEGTRL
jgi:hypothetical protein